jgi:hypothetical protein
LIGRTLGAQDVDDPLQCFGPAQVISAADNRLQRRIDFREFMIMQWTGPPPEGFYRHGCAVNSVNKFFIWSKIGFVITGDYGSTTVV